MAAHSEISHVIKENHPGDTRSVGRFTKNGTNQDIRSSRFKDGCSSIDIKVTSKSISLFRQRTTSQFWASLDD
jgi:hypothetical protein